MALALQIKRGKLWLVNLKMLTVKQFMIDTVLTLRRGYDHPDKPSTLAPRGTLVYAAWAAGVDAARAKS